MNGCAWGGWRLSGRISQHALNTGSGKGTILQSISDLLHLFFPFPFMLRIRIMRSSSCLQIHILRRTELIKQSRIRTLYPSPAVPNIQKQTNINPSRSQTIVSSSFYASEPNSQITINQVSNAISPSNPASGSSR